MYRELLEKLYRIEDQLVRCTNGQQVERLTQMLKDVNRQLDEQPTPQV